jgi:hypothetical protein
VTIYYFPYPTAQPAPATVAGDNYFGAQDAYINQNGAARTGVLGTGLSAGKITLGNYDLTKPYLGVTGSRFPGLASPPTPPNIVATTLVPTLNFTQGTLATFNPVSVYGGSAIPTEILNVSINPALPAGLAIKKTRVDLNVSGTAPTISGSGTSWSVTYQYTSNGQTPVAGSFYAVRGQTKTSYNGIWECTAVTVSTITLRYNANPSLSGGTSPIGQVAWNTGATVSITDATVKSITAADTVNYWYNYLDIVIAGTPTVASPSTSYVMTFTDASGQTGSATFTLAVAAGATQLGSTLDTASRTLTQNLSITAFKPVNGTGGIGTLTYSINPALPAGLTFNTATGFISGTPSVSFAQNNFVITVSDSSGATSSKTFSLEILPPALITVQNVSSRTLIRTIAFTAFTPVTASGGITPLAFSISPALPAGLSFNTSTGVVSGTATEAIAASTYTVSVTDSSSPSQVSSKTFSLTVEALPALNSTLLVATSTFIKNTTITAFTPVSASGGYLTLSYAISPALPAGLTFSTTTGQISGRPTVTSTQTQYTVTITDQATQTTSKQFTILVGPPVLSTTLAISSRTLIQNSQVSAPFTPVTASGGEGTLTFAISPSLPSGLSFNTATGQITGSSTVVSANTNNTVTVTDSNSTPQTSSKTFSLKVDPAPILIISSIGTKTLVQNLADTPFIPITATGGFGTLTFAINPALPTGLNFNAATGQVSGTATIFRTATNHTVTVSDQATQSASESFSLTVETPPLQAQQSVAGSTLIRTVPISAFTPVTATGGSLIYSYGVAPNLSAGLAFSTSTGQITGTPTVVSTETTYTVTVTDSLSQTASNTFKITVNEPPPLTTTLVISSATFNRVTDTISIVPVSASGGFGSISFAISPSLPAGLSFNSGNGRISGVATVLVNQTYTITANDSIAQVSSKQFNLTLNNPPVTATTVIASTTATRTKETTAFKPVNGAGGIAPLVYSISPSLPATMTLNVNTGLVGGKPNSLLTATSFTVIVSDSVGSSNSSTFLLTVIDPPPVNTVLSTASVELVISQTITPVIPVTATGGDGTLVFSISPSLPTGLQFASSTGRITGTPVALLTSTNFTVTVTDSLSQTSSNTFSLSVIAQPLVAVVNNPTIVLTEYVQITAVSPVTATGGTGSKTYSISPSLPIGLTFNTASGQITGTPTTESSATYTVTALDSVGITASANFNLVVNDAVPPSLVAAPQNSDVALELNAETEFQPVIVSGGFGAVTYSISPNLPAGLSFNTATGFITGIPTVLTNSAAFTVTVQDTVPQTASATFNLIVVFTPVAGGKGFTGSKGYTGSIGFTGSQGITGFTGSQGIAGDLGYTGSQGVGFTGSRGESGFVGSVGYTGSIGFTGSQGAGFTGSQGETGFVGSVGYTGSQGTGFTGSQGETGFVGSVGFIGSIGYTGSQGSGFTGSQGETGFTGSKGDLGYTGSQGIPGEYAAVGYTGSAGSGSSIKIVDQTTTITNTVTSITFLGDGVSAVSSGTGAVVVTISGGSGASGNYDGGTPDSNHVGITALDAGYIV